MKRRIVNMDPEEFSKLRYEGAGSLVERNVAPDGIHLVNPFVVAKHESTDLMELAKQIQMADTMVKVTACNKLSMIAKQIRFLQQKAHEVLLEAKQSSDLHHAACNFRKLQGHVYYLYERPSGQRYFSMLSPEDWGRSPPHPYIGAYRLEQDLSWTPEAQMAEKCHQMSLVDKLLTSTDVRVSRELTDFTMQSD